MQSSYVFGLTLVLLGVNFGCGSSESDGDDGSSRGGGGSGGSSGRGGSAGTSSGSGGSSGASAGGSSQGGANTGGSNPSGGASNGGTNPSGGAGGDLGGEGGGGAGGAGAGGDGQGGQGDAGDNPGGSGNCTPITNDASSIGVSCEGSSCPQGYTCQDFNGVVLQQLCSILCQNDCECPSGLSCVTMTDKVSTWRECRDR